MLTIFTIPKAFEGHAGLIQTNALRSWIEISPRPEILLMGDDPGVADAASAHSVRHVPGVARNGYGTPLVSSAFQTAAAVARGSALCYVNADIIFTRGLLEAHDAVSARLTRFLVVGQRIDLEIDKAWELDSEGRARLEQLARESGVLHPPTGIDYFVFPRGQFERIPPFAVGRPGWDNWLLYHARRRRIPLIDATKVVCAIHQNHEYGAPGRKRTAEEVWTGPEAQANRQLARHRLYFIDDATFVLDRDGLKRRPRSLSRDLRRWQDTHPGFRRLTFPLRAARRLRARAPIRP